MVFEELNSGTQLENACNGTAHRCLKGGALWEEVVPCSTSHCAAPGWLQCAAVAGTSTMLHNPQGLAMPQAAQGMASGLNMSNTMLNMLPPVRTCAGGLQASVLILHGGVRAPAYTGATCRTRAGWLDGTYLPNFCV